MIGPLYSLLCRHKSSAVDGILVEACRLGDPDEVAAAAEAILHRKNAGGLTELLSLFPDLPTPVADRLLEEGPALATAAARAARGENPAGRVAAARFIGAAGRGDLVYVLGDLLRTSNPATFAAACEAIAELAHRCESAQQALRIAPPGDGEGDTYEMLISVRNKLLPVVARALDLPRGSDTPSLADAAVALLEEAAGPLHEAFKRHGGRPWPLVLSRLRRPTSRAAVVATLRSGCRRALRQELPAVFASLEQPEPLLSLRENSFLLVDPNLQLGMANATDGPWLTPEGLREALDGLEAGPADSEPSAIPETRAAAVLGIARWVLASDVGGSLRDELFEMLFACTTESPELAVALLREASIREAGVSMRIAQVAAGHSDERVVRIATRHLARSGGNEARRELLGRLPGAPASVRNVLARRIARRSFEALWVRYESIPVAQRAQALSTMCRLLNETVSHLRHRLLTGPASARLRALTMVGEAHLCPRVREAVFECCRLPEAKVRSKAVLLLEHVASTSADPQLDPLLDDALVDADPRVRANAIEVLERTGRRELRSLLDARSRVGRNRERANAIKALGTLRLIDPHEGLFEMLRDTRDAHRLSAIWAVEETSQWKLLDEVARLARTDPSVRVRRNAMSSVRRMAQNMRSPAQGQPARIAPRLIRPAA